MHVFAVQGYHILGSGLLVYFRILGERPVNGLCLPDTIHKPDENEDIHKVAV